MAAANHPIRVGVIGAGANTRLHHIPKLQRIDGVRVVSVCNRSRASSERVAAEFGIPSTHETWHELIAAPDIDAIVIGTWPYLHCQLTVAALEANKHVLCEARMACNASEARRMLAASHDHPDRVAQIVPSPMTLHVDRTVQRLLAEGYLGELLAIELRDGNSFLDRESPLHWRQDFELSGLNVMFLGIWYEALLRWVGEATSVMAMGKTYVKMRRDAEGRLRAVRIPEHLDVLADMACGAQLHMQSSSVSGLAGPASATLFGSRGTLRFTEGKLFGGRSEDAQLTEIPIPEQDAGGWRVEEEFIGAIRGRERVKLTTFSTGAQYMEFTEAVYRSMSERRGITLPL